MKRIILAACLLAGPAAAHDSMSGWSYPVQCCGGGPNGDCREAAEGEVVEVRGGWRVVPSGEFFPFDRVPPSPDGKIHRCVQDPKDISSRTRCLFAPVGSS